MVQTVRVCRWMLIAGGLVQRGEELWVSLEEEQWACQHENVSHLLLLTSVGGYGVVSLGVEVFQGVFLVWSAPGLARYLLVRSPFALATSVIERLGSLLEL